MRQRRRLQRNVALVALGALVGAGSALAAPPTATAPVVYVRKDCTGIDDCIPDDDAIASDGLNQLHQYLYGTSGRWPSASDPVLVDIGAGTFKGGFVCASEQSGQLRRAGFVSYRGAGRERTHIEGTVIAISARTAMLAADCEQIAFENLSMASDLAVYWLGGGRSNWTDVELHGTQTAWYDTCPSATSPGNPLGEHFFWNSKLVGNEFAYLADCGLTWFYGSDLLLDYTVGTGSPTHEGAGIVIAHSGDVRAFGTSIRVVSDGIAAAPTGGFDGVRIGHASTGAGPAGDGVFHMHGGEIVVDSRALPGVDATGVDVDDQNVGGASAHLNETAIELLVAGTGTARRVFGTGTHRSPFLWSPGTDPPFGGPGGTGLDSKTGQDAFVDIGGSSPRLMIYDASCVGTGGPWWDTVGKACRP